MGLVNACIHTFKFIYFLQKKNITYITLDLDKKIHAMTIKGYIEFWN